MLDPYKMIVVNIATSIILIIGLLFYKFVFPKRKFDLFFLLLLISILPIISIFRNGDYESGDFNIHIYRTMAFYDSLKEGNIMPSWAKDLNATYGYPLFIFNYPLPYYVISFFHFIGFSFIASTKIFIALNFVLSGIFMYLYSREIFKNNLAAFTSAIFYIFAPYHLIDVHFKVAIGEIAVFTLLPLVFLSIHKLNTKRSLIYILWSGLWLSLIIMSNALIAFFATGIILAYIIFFTLKKIDYVYFLYGLSAFFVAGIISLYVLLAPFIFNSFLYIQRMPLVIGYSPNLSELFYSPWRMGFLFQGPNGQIPFLIGYTQLFIFIITLILLLLKKMPKKHLSQQKFWLIISLVIIFLITPYSKFLWEHFSFVKAAGSHRLLLILSFSVSILAGYLTVNFLKKKFLITLIILITIGYTILNWGHRKLIPEITDSVLKQNLWKSTSEGEGHYYANSKWIDTKHPWFSKLPRNNIEIIKGDGEITTLKRTSTNHTYIIYAKTPLDIAENTLYFPGWQAKSNGKIISLHPNGSGVINLNVPKGNQILELTYNDIKIYKISKIVSATALFILFVYILFLSTKKLFLFKRY